MTPAEMRAKIKAAHPDATDKELDAMLVKTKAEHEAEKEMSFAHSNAVRGVEIFASGLHNGDQYTEQDIDDIIAAHKELDFRPAIKIGHSKDAPGAPAYGWVTALRKVGGKLVADFESMHDSVITALKDKRYDRVSSEIYFNLKRGGKQFRRALKAVALLGADVPAVAGLTPLHKMEFIADGFGSVASCEQGLEIQKQSIIDSLTERVAALTEAAETAALEREVEVLEDQVAVFGGDEEGKWVTIRGRAINIKKGESVEAAMKRGGGDSPTKPVSVGVLNPRLEFTSDLLERFPSGEKMRAHLKTLDKQKLKQMLGEIKQSKILGGSPKFVAELINEVLTGKREFNQKEHDAMTIKELQEKKAALEAKLAELKKTGGQSDEAEIAAFEADIAEFGDDIKNLEQAEATAAENAALKSRLATLETKDRAREVADRVARCKVVAFREDLEAVYAHAMANPAAKVKHFAVKDGKRVESEKPVIEVIDSLVASINAASKQIFTVVSTTGGIERQEGPSEDAGAELDAKSKARVREGKSKNYAEAMDAVLADDAELAAKYHEQQSARRS